MKQCFTHRMPSAKTLLSDPWPEDFAKVRDKIEKQMDESVVESVLKSLRRAPRVQSALK